MKDSRSHQILPFFRQGCHWVIPGRWSAKVVSYLLCFHFALLLRSHGHTSPWVVFATCQTLSQFSGAASCHPYSSSLHITPKFLFLPFSELTSDFRYDLSFFLCYHVHTSYFFLTYFPTSATIFTFLSLFPPPYDIFSTFTFLKISWQPLLGSKHSEWVLSTPEAELLTFGGGKRDRLGNLMDAGSECRAVLVWVQM